MGAAVVQLIVVAVLLAVVGYLTGAMVNSIRNEMRRSGVRKVWSNFGLSISLAVLFFVSWVAQLLAEWQVFVDEQRAHEEPTQIGDFLIQFSQSTLENWQSEFLQLFSFVVLAAVYIHRGSAESRDSDDRMEEALKRIEKKLEVSRS